MFKEIFAIVLVIVIQNGHGGEMSSRSEDGLRADPVYPEGNQVVFIERGTVVNQIGFVHVKMVFDLGHVKKIIDEAVSDISGYIKAEETIFEQESERALSTDQRIKSTALTNLEISKSYQETLENVRERVLDSEHFFGSILIGLPFSEEEGMAAGKLMHRQQRHTMTESEGIPVMSDEEVKRQGKALGVIGGVLGLGGSLISMFSLLQINRLYEKFGNLQKSHNRLVDLTQAHEEAIKGIHLDIESVRKITTNLATRNPVHVNTMSDRLHDYLSQVQNRVQGIIDSTQISRLSSRAINGQTLIDLWLFLKQIAEKEDFDILAKHAFDLYQMEASFLYDHHTFEFILFVHVPMIPPGNLLELFQFMPFPMKIQEAMNTSMIPEVGDQTYLALNNKQEYRLMSPTDINACEKKGTSYFCSGRNVLYDDLEDTCLGSFYLKSDKGVEENCEFEYVKKKALVVPAGFRKWLVYSPEDVSAKVMCRKVTRSLPPILVKEQTVLEVKEGCSLHAGRAHISADENIDVGMKIHYVQWPAGKTLFKGLEEKARQEKLRRIGDFGYKKYIAKDLSDLKNHDSFETPSFFSTVIFSFLGAGVIILAIVVIAFFVHYRKGKSTQKNWVRNVMDAKEKDVLVKVRNEAVDVVEKRIEEVKQNPVFARPPGTLPKRTAPTTPIATATTGTDTLRFRKTASVKKPMASLVCAVKKSADRSQGGLYPNLGGSAKTNCSIPKGMSDKYKGKNFYCTYHDDHNGCSGVFLASKCVSHLSREEIHKDELGC